MYFSLNMIVKHIFIWALLSRNSKQAYATEHLCIPFSEKLDLNLGRPKLGGGSRIDLSQDLVKLNDGQGSSKIRSNFGQGKSILEIQSQ